MRRLTRYCSLLSTVLAAVWHAPANAEDLQARSWAASCAACHGTGGRSSNDLPALAGKNKNDLYQALIDFKTGQRKTATVMHRHAKGYTDEQLERIAAFYSRQPRQ